MGDIIQGILEDMVPDLLDYIERDIFTEKEVKKIISKRRFHEYKIMRPNPEKRFFLNAIQYEVLLEEKRHRNQVEMSVPQSSLDNSIIKRIHALFRRFTNCFKQDASVWKEYINFCVRSKSYRQLNQVLAKAIQFHPTDESVWLIAKCVEEKVRNDIEAARKLMQRSVKINPSSLALWKAYIDFEKTHGTPEIVKVVMEYAPSSLK